ncbi:hypothetical protein SPFL3102_02375 [Sporomusaceae bacterium FL31]|nr:hypothetical protein SPFL3101_02209 [Sporomusaceae bacterium FL31]GCE34558.1 hypothetical protein SPFL3102_02375 [Sporomusaceae bacterium]
MSVMVAAQLKAGFIFGDNMTQEYVYMPGGEIGLENPMCVLETMHNRQDVEFSRAVQLVQKLSLKLVNHPRLGSKSC